VLQHEKYTSQLQMSMKSLEARRKETLQSGSSRNGDPPLSRQEKDSERRAAPGTHPQLGCYC